jgi:hypothetical protein
MTTTQRISYTSPSTLTDDQLRSEMQTAAHIVRTTYNTNHQRTHRAASERLLTLSRELDSRSQ